MGDVVPRILATGFAPVPGSSRDAAALLSLASAVRGSLDLIAMKTSRTAHSEYMMGARMFRVPVGTGSAREQRQLFGRAIVRQIESERYDVVHVRGPIEGALVAARKPEDGFRLVYEIASFPEKEDEAEWVRAHAQCCRASDLVLVPTHAASRALTQQGYAENTAVLPPGVDIHRFDWWPAQDLEVLRVLFLGNFRDDRDLDTLLRAIRQLELELPVELMLAGDPNGRRRAALRERAKSFGLSATVSVRGEPRPELTPLLVGAADVCVCSAAPASRFQDYGDVPEPLLEYLACRRPVVAAAVPGMEEMVSHDREALHYEPGNANSLYLALRRFGHDNALRNRLVTAAHRRVRTAFSGGARRRRLAEIYEQLCPGSQRYDPWVDAFDPLETGQSVLPTGNAFGLDSALEDHDTTLRPSQPELNETLPAEDTMRLPEPAPRFTRQRRSTDVDAAPFFVDAVETATRPPVAVGEIKDTIDSSREALGLPETPPELDQPEDGGPAPDTHKKKSGGSPKGNRRSKRS